MKNFLAKLSLALRDPVLRSRMIITLVLLVIFRFLANIPIPGFNLDALQRFFENSQFFGLLNLFSGGGLSNFSIVMLGVGPYITASIIMQLLTMLFPKLKTLYQEEGEAGRRKFAQYSRMLAVPLAVIQAFGFITLLQRQNVIGSLDWFGLATNIIIITGGSILLMWLGELITEFGIGNGVSLIIFGGIVASLPQTLTQLTFAFDPVKIPTYLGFLMAALAVVFGVVIITEAERPIPVTYAKRVRGTKVYGGVSTYLPLRLNQAGVIPIIFALSILLFPQMIFRFLANVPYDIVQNISKITLQVLENQWVYSGLYFILVFLFTYFYTAVTFDPDTLSSNLQKSGAFIPGVRPGQSTSHYISKILLRLTFVGALFLALIAVLPLAMQAITQNSSLAIGGTGLLIVVSVVLELVKQIDAQISMREY